MEGPTILNSTNIQTIEELIPEIGCTHCGTCCSLPVMTERERIKIGIFIKVNKIEMNYDNIIICPFRDKEFECSIYKVRPFMCRIKGVSEYSKCLHHAPYRMVTNREYRHMMKIFIKELLEF